MEETEQQVFDGFAEQKGEAKFGLYRNAAKAARYAKKNSNLLIIIIVLLAFILIKDKWYSDEQTQTTGLKTQTAEHLAIISEQKRQIEKLQTRVYDVKYLPYPAQQVMYYSAYHTVAENLRPKDLSQWIGKATPQEWIGYLRMAVARNSNHVYEAIMEHDDVTSIPMVAKFIKSTPVLVTVSNKVCEDGNE